MAAANFTFTRHLKELWLCKCGIETIDADTFDNMQNTLTLISLDENMIRTISFEMFRSLYEAKAEYIELYAGLSKE